MGINTLSTAVSESAETIEEVYEPFLIQQGFIVRTPRGREVTKLAYDHLGFKKKRILRRNYFKKHKTLSNLKKIFICNMLINYIFIRSSN